MSRKPGEAMACVDASDETSGRMNRSVATACCGMSRDNPGADYVAFFPGVGLGAMLMYTCVHPVGQKSPG
jgi:hypothetical protein